MKKIATGENHSSSSSSSYSITTLKAIKFLLGLVFLGWLMIWVMTPTDTYMNKWLPKLLAQTNSTYFGEQGTNILIFTFPILLISVLACLYLHMMKRSDRLQFRKSGRRLEVLKKPVMVMGPLGIINAVELAFALMFLTLVVWASSMYISNFSADITAMSAAKYGLKVWQAKLEVAGVSFGLVGNICCAFLFFPVTRGSSLLPLVGLTSESSIKYHIWLGHLAMVLFTIHGLCYIVSWIASGRCSEMLEWVTHGIGILPGEIALLAGLIMWATTHSRIRRKMFELFFYAHQLYIVFLIFYMLHVFIAFYCYILPGIYLFMVDRFLRFLQSRQKVRLVCARLLPSESVELNFSKSPGFSYAPLSTLFINIPSISWLQWHPFTVNSNSNFDPDKISVIIKKEGSWTQKLYQVLNQTSLDHLNVSIEGPYGPSSVNFLSHDSLILVSGGSGITPFISIIRELIHRSSVVGAPTPTLLLICTFRTSSDLTMLDLLLPVSTTTTSDLSKLNLTIEAFVTREKAAPASNAHKLIRTVWFKPHPSHEPVSPVFGPNSWLWLAAVVCSSFAAYLLLIGILTRFYIYPRQSTGITYSLTATSLLNLLFMCVCVATTASAAFLFNKKQSSMEAKQVQMFDGPTPKTYPGPWLYSGGREMESVPQQSLSQVTRVNYGRRPALKEMIMRSEGASVGVMASGPRGLRREVAAICSSAEAHNLHFESVSFTW